MALRARVSWKGELTSSQETPSKSRRLSTRMVALYAVQQRFGWPELHLIEPLHDFADALLLVLEQLIQSKLVNFVGI